jgi:hypothetical protein
VGVKATVAEQAGDREVEAGWIGVHLEQPLRHFHAEGVGVLETFRLLEAVQAALHPLTGFAGQLALNPAMAHGEAPGGCADPGRWTGIVGSQMNTFMAKWLQRSCPVGAVRVAWLAAGLLGASGLAIPAHADNTRHDCLLWNRSGGAERVELGNRIGASNLLTKQHNFATAQPGDSQSLYSSADLRRLCVPR